MGLAEADARFRGGGFDLRAEIAELFIVNSYRVNDYLGLLGQDAVPARGRGFYAQAGYDVLATDDPGPRQALLFFAGYENVNPRSEMSPYNYNPPTITPPGQTLPRCPPRRRRRSCAGDRLPSAPGGRLQGRRPGRARRGGARPLPPLTVTGAPGTPRALRTDVAEAARGKTRVGFAFAFMF